MEIVNLNYLNLFKLPSPRGYSEYCPWNNRPQWSCDFCGLVEECLQRGFFFFLQDTANCLQSIICFVIFSSGFTFQTMHIHASQVGTCKEFHLAQAYVAG